MGCASHPAAARLTTPCPPRAGIFNTARTTGPDDSSFCRRITEALQNGWELYGDPQLTGDVNGRYCGQAVVKEIGDSYDPAKPLGDY